MGESSESQSVRQSSSPDQAATTRPPANPCSKPMGDVQCAACRARFSLVVGTSLRIWQNAQGQLLQVELQCPRCQHLEQVPIQTRLIFGSVPLPHRELALRGADDGHHPTSDRDCVLCETSDFAHSCPYHGKQPLG